MLTIDRPRRWLKATSGWEVPWPRPRRGPNRAWSYAERTPQGDRLDGPRGLDGTGLAVEPEVTGPTAASERGVRFPGASLAPLPSTSHNAVHFGVFNLAPSTGPLSPIGPYRK